MVSTEQSGRRLVDFLLCESKETNRLRRETVGPVSAIRLLVGAILLCASSSITYGQTPTVTITNTTRGGHSVFYVGDTWLLGFYTAAGSGLVAAALDPNGYCAMYGDGWDIGPSIDAQLDAYAAYYIQFSVWDNGVRPGFSTSIPPEYYYPYFDLAAFGFFAINLTSGEITAQWATVGLVVDFTYY